MRRPASTDGRLRAERLAVLPGGQPTWQVTGRPLRVVAVDRVWHIVAVGAESRELLDEHHLLGRRFPSRGAALRALAAVLP